MRVTAADARQRAKEARVAVDAVRLANVDRITCAECKALPYADGAHPALPQAWNEDPSPFHHPECSTLRTSKPPEAAPHEPEPVNLTPWMRRVAPVHATEK